jgi:hypothetical protein
MEKKLIRLTEGDLQKIVKESVNNSLNEFFFFKTDPSEADNEEEYKELTNWRKGLQKKEGEKAQDEHPFAKDTRKASDYWTKKEKGQYTSPKQMRKKTKKGFNDEEED